MMTIKQETAPDTSAEVERIRARQGTIRLPDATGADLDCRVLLAALDRVTREHDALAKPEACDGCGVLRGVHPEYCGEPMYDRDCGDHYEPDRCGEWAPVSEIVRDLRARISAAELERDEARAERDALAARLPSPESVTRARLVAAEIVEVYVYGARNPVAPVRPEREIANACAIHIRDRARTHSGTRDEGGDVDEAMLLVCAEDADGCATLGQLEELVSEWREVRGG